jgi:L-2-hydroxyglutarate oxidase LhgO
MESLDCVVIGAGVVGLAAARALALAGREVVVLEAEKSIGTGISSRNSEVIHAGLYYPEGSHKARLCPKGNALLYAYCEQRKIAHRRLGKLVIATEREQIGVLKALRAAAQAAGVPELQWLAPEEVGVLEPELSCVAGLFSPTSGIVDSHALMLSLQADAEEAGALFAFQSPVISGAISDPGPILTVGTEPSLSVRALTVVNCAGLGAQGLARSIRGLAPESIPEESFAKGCYFSLTTPSPFAHLVYPVPEPGGLGVHLTLDLAGRARFGPDVEWLETTDVLALDYRVDPSRAASFTQAIRRYWPGLPENALVPDYAGVRPKLKRAQRGFSDFILSGPQSHGARGLYNLFAIESPGLTCCLALGDWILALVSQEKRHA